MARPFHLACAVLVATACAEKARPGATADYCAEADGYEFRNFSDFSAAQVGWFLYADNTPGGVPDPTVTSNVMSTVLPAPGRCGDTGVAELRAYGHNYYGSGFGEYSHNTNRDTMGALYEGLSFWAKSPGNTDKTFLLYVDDGRTIVLSPETPDGGVLPVATTADEDLDGDGFVGPGDVARGTRCRLPPSNKLGQPACYYGGTLPPSTPTRVPEPDECGNQFHTFITTTEEWQLYRVPWSQLVQWPCPNRLAGGIDTADIAKIEIKFVQGSNYDLWLDNVAFYRQRQAGDGGTGN